MGPCRVESRALPCPLGCETNARHVAGNALGDEGFVPRVPAAASAWSRAASVPVQG